MTNADVFFIIESPGLLYQEYINSYQYQYHYINICFRFWMIEFYGYI